MGKILQCEEIIFTEKCIIKFVQKISFGGPQDERIASLFAFLDTAGIIRLKAEGIERADLRDFGIPAVLTCRHPEVEMVVLRVHEKAGHVVVLVSEVLNPQRAEEYSSHSLKMCCVQTIWTKTYHKKPTDHPGAT